MKTEKVDKLSQEVSMAIASGMSYGKWKAMQPVAKPVPVEIEAADTKPKKTAVCLWCGNTFTQNHGRKKYCDDYCRRQADNKRCRERRKEKAKKWRAKNKEGGIVNES